MTASTEAQLAQAQLAQPGTSRRWTLQRIANVGCQVGGGYPPAMPPRCPCSWERGQAWEGRGATFLPSLVPKLLGPSLQAPHKGPLERQGGAMSAPVRARPP